MGFTHLFTMFRWKRTLFHWTKTRTNDFSIGSPFDFCHRTNSYDFFSSECIHIINNEALLLIHSWKNDLNNKKARNKPKTGNAYIKQMGKINKLRNKQK